MPFNQRKQKFSALAAAAWLILSALWSAQSATFTIVNQDGPNEGFNQTTPATPVGGNTGTTLGQQRINVFAEAGRQWGALLQSSVDIRVQAQFNPLPAGVLGSAGPINGFRDFPNAPVPNTLFPSALANALAGADQDPAQNDINAQFSSDFTFYMGFDHLVPAGQVDLLVVLLHEMGHGLGFLTFVNRSTGAKSGGTDDHYMRFLVDEASGLNWSDMSDGQRANSSTSNGQLQWSGAFAVAASSGLSAGNGSVGPRMYAPPILAGGSSVSHYDTVVTPNDLMEPFITSMPQQFMTEALFRDIGWPFDDGGSGPVTLRIEDQTVIEGNNGITMMDFNVTLSAGTNSAVTVNFTTADDSAVAGSDYIATNGVVTFPANATTAPLTVLVQTDSIQEANERFFVNLSGAVGVVLADNQAIGTITDDDGVEVTVTDVNFVEGNSGLNNMVFTVDLTGGTSTQDVSVNYTTADGTATDGVDYTGATGTLVFPPGFLSMNISVPITGDLLPEPDENLFLNLTGSTNAVIADFQAIGTIVNDDAGSVLSITGANLTELNAGTRDMLFQVVLFPPSAANVTVDFATSDGTATAGADYTAATGTLNFPAGETNRSIAIQIAGDTLVEINETFFVTLSNPAGAFINIGQGIGTIVEDDGGFISDLVVTRNTNAFDLARAITGSGITGLVIKEVRLNAHTNPLLETSAGLFELLGEAPHTYGLSDPGVIISTGDVLDYESGISSGPANTTAFGPSGFVGAPANTQQEILLDPITTSGGVEFNHFDATQLDIRFDAPDGFNQVSFRVTFGSEEFPEFVNSPFIDGFGIYLNGTNIAFTGGAPININHPDMQPLSGTELDGVIAQGESAVLQFNALITPGSKDNTLTFVIADTEDGRLDSTVYISSLKASSPFSTGTAPTIASVAPLRQAVQDEIIIFGDNFGATPAENIVFIGPTQAIVTEASPTLLKVRKVPFGASYGYVTVTANGLTASSPLPFSAIFPSSEIIDQESYDAPVNFLSGGIPEDVVVGDLDNDGRPDMAVVNLDSNHISIFRNMTIPTSISPGSFTTGIDLPTLAAPSNLAIGDLNGDGKLDLVVVCNGAAVISVYQNTTENSFISFSPGFSYAAGNDPRGVAIGDLDQDGRQDIAVTDAGSGFISVFRNVRDAVDLGTDSFADKVNYLVGSIPLSIAIGDITGDRISDLVVANSFDGPGGNTISILRNLGLPGVIDSRTFAVRQNISATAGPPGTSVGPTDITLADMDNDQLLDIITANSKQQTVSVHLNGNGAPGSFDPPVDFSSGLATRHLAIADIDGDGHPDIAVANPSLNALTLLKNTSTMIGSTAFAAPVEHSLPASPLGVAFGDLDQNGKPELISANANGSVSILRNTMRSTSTINSWNPNPSTLVHGEPLTSAQLNATTLIDGTFIYNPPAGTILPAGTTEVVATFVPNDFINNSIETDTRTITVSKATPVLSWPYPTDIQFGTPLAAAQLNATANTPGTFVYTPEAGEILDVQAGRMLLVNFTPDQTENFVDIGAAAFISVVPADPNIVWPTPPPLQFGDTLDMMSHLNAETVPFVDGDYSFSIPAGTALPVGSHDVTVTFTPNVPGNYNTAMATVTIEVLPATPNISWNPPADITYGDPLTLIDHLNPSPPVDGMSAPIAGTFTFMPLEGTILNAGDNQTLTATFTPDDPANYTGASATVTINVSKAAVGITWPNPANITFGTALNTLDHLNAIFDGYVPPQFHPLTSGGATEARIQITEVGTSSGSIEIRYQFYNSPDQMQVFYDGNLLFDTGIISNPPGGGGPGSTLDLFETIVYPSGDDNFIEIVMNPGGGAGITTWDFDAIFQPVIAGVATYFPAAGATLSAGDNQTLTVTFTPVDSVNFNITTQTAIINVLKKDPVITWTNPADIVFGTALNFTEHLNASGEVTVPGQFTYNPTPGTVLNAGPLQALEVQFTPNDPANFNVVTTAVDINVTQADSVIGWNDPADTVYGTLLNTTDHLNATANTPGQFDYSPDVDAQLDAGAGQALSVTFTPDSPNFSIGMATATINVLKADPTITWSNPAAIQFGTALSGIQLNAITDTLGTPVYTPPITTLLPRGNGQILTVDFTPSDTANFNNATATVTIDVVRADPIIIWNTQANAVFPYTLAANRLDAAVVGDLPGDFVYTPAEGALFDAGTHSLSVTFTPTSDDYNPVTKSISLIVDKAPALIAWNDPDDIIFGTLLDDTQLNATSTLPGSFVYDPPTGALLNAENNKRLQVVFTPDDQMNYQASATAFADLNILKATPVLSWNNPASIPLGTALSAAQLNATANVPGQFSYNPDLGEVLLVGPSQLLTVSFTPDDQLNYNSEIGGVLITVDMGDPEIVWSNPGDIDFGTPLSGAELNAQSPVAGQFVYTPPLTTLLNAGPAQTLSVQFTPDNTADYNSVTRDVAINVRKIDPIVDWPEPSAIPYETPLGAQQLNATANVPGVFSHSPPTGAILNAGNGQMLHASFTPTDSANYNTVQASTLINVTKLNPSLSWNTPASITFGDPLTSAQLNAVSDIPGSFVYTQPASTVLNPGIGQPLQAQFTPTDAGNYESGLIGTTIDVLPAEPLVTWSNPGDIVFGQALKNEQLNATASIPGTFDYTPPLSTILDAGSGQPLDVTFTPTDNVNYTAATAQVFINVLKADPVLSWQNPIDILFGTALSATQLNAMHDIPGSFAYTQPAGTVLNAGDNQTLTAVFTSNDPANFNGGTVNASINVGKANASIAWNTPAPITFGDPLGASQLNATANTPGTFTYSPPAGSVLSAGNELSLNVSFTPTDAQNYFAASATVLIDVLQANSVITWSNPADIIEGAPLTLAQLNATANVAGSFVYNPGLGAVLAVGDNQTLNVTFSPSDSVNFAGYTATVKINVKSVNQPPTVQITDPIDGRAVLPLANLTLSANASDAGSIAKVEFFEGATKLGESTVPPYSAVFSAIPLGTYVLTAVATDDLGLTTTSASINISAQAAPTSVEISPTTGAITVGLVGESGMDYRVEVSEDLRTWISIGTFTGTGGVSSFLDSTIAAQVGSRFYRLVLLP